jgi:hypothetical protein
MLTNGHGVLAFRVANGDFANMALTLTWPFQYFAKESTRKTDTTKSIVIETLF